MQEMQQSNVDTKVAVLEHRVEQTHHLLEKLDTAIEKIVELSAEVAKTLAVHEERLTKHDEVNEELYHLVEKRRYEMSESVKELNNQITDSGKEQTAALIETEHRIMAAIASLKVAVTSEQNAVNTRALEMDKRISSLERWRWILVGGGIAAGFLIRTFIPIILSAVR
jgi:cob(I)alamin adenosyltransferase